MTHDRTPLWLNTDLELQLRRIASDCGISFPTLVEEALHDYMLRRTPAQYSEDAAPVDRGAAERRRWPRVRLGVPAVVHTAEPNGRNGRYRTAEVRDISPAGIGLRFDSAERGYMRVGRVFEILVQLGEHSRPVCLVCTTCRKVLDGASLMVGAVFNEPVPDLDTSLSTLT